MCDPGEKVSNTLKREFMEEATDSLNMTKEKKEEVEKKLKGLFKKGIEVSEFKIFNKFISLKRLYCFLRYTKVMQMTRETQIIRGWRQLRANFMTVPAKFQIISNLKQVIQLELI